ncbi:MAG: hypothetical protein AAB659_00090 [Patescibacteria group bacterium]
MIKHIVNPWIASALLVIISIVLAFFVMPEIAVSTKISSDDIHLDVHMLKSDGFIYQTGNQVAVYGPAIYEVAYDVPSGADCYFNVAHNSVYGKGKVSTTANIGTSQGYTISCQSLIGSSGIVSKTVTVSVMPHTEISALASQSAF